MFAALIAVLGLVPKLDAGFGVPITAQSMGIMLCGTILGARRGMLAVLSFLTLTALGLPLLAGGLGVFASPSVGYLIGFPVAAFSTGLVVERWKVAILPAALAGSVIGGILILYAFGIPGIALMTSKPLGQAALASMAFLPGDIIKAVLAAFVTQGVARARPDALLSRQQ